jgi:hypothetical protein
MRSPAAILPSVAPRAELVINASYSQPTSSRPRIIKPMPAARADDVSFASSPSTSKTAKATKSPTITNAATLRIRPSMRKATKRIQKPPGRPTSMTVAGGRAGQTGGCVAVVIASPPKQSGGALLHRPQAYHRSLPASYW